MMLDWLIIGGGIHGVHLAVRLLAEAKIAPERLRIIDPEPTLLHRWRVCTEATGMEHLRSPVVHHLDVDPWSLSRFAGRPRHRRPGAFAAPYNRPALSLFNAHCDHVIETWDLQALHVRARVEEIRVSPDGARVDIGEAGQMEARHVLLALGMGSHPERPEWAPADDPRIVHLFDRDFSWGALDDVEDVTIVGGGISAAQAALRLCRARRRVRIVARHPPREHQFDSEPGWLGPKFMNGFLRERDLVQRRALIQQARHRGSMPPDVARAVRLALSHGSLEWIEADVTKVDAGARLTVQSAEGPALTTDALVLATGFQSRRAGGELIDRLVADASLPCAACGSPIVDDHLRWHPRVCVSGPLAELTLGPTARNIAGARNAGDRIIGYAKRAAAGA